SRAIAPSLSAPKVRLFDLSECAARRNRSASPAASAARRSCCIRGASLRKVSTSSPTNSAPAVCCSASKVARSIVVSLMSSVLAWLHLVQRLDQPVHADRLGQVVVHSRVHAHLAIALHRVGGHGDDARPLL